MRKANMQKLRLSLGLILIVGALLAAGCNGLKFGGSADDKAITTQIQSKLFDDPVLKTRDIHVTSEKGVVTLTGTVGTDLEKAAVERIANGADGAKSVVNQLVSSSPAVTAPATAGPAQTAGAAPAPSMAERAPSSRRRQHAASALRSGPVADQASANEAPAPAQPEMAAQPAAPPSAPAAPPAPVVKQPEHITIPTGTVFSVRMIDTIDSTKNHSGDEFTATLGSPVLVGDRVVVPQNADAHVRLVQATSAGHMSGQSTLQVELASVTVGDQTYQLQTSYYSQAGASRGTRTAETVGGGAILGGLLGAIAGHGKGAAIGSVLGAGAGTATQAGTHGQQVKIPSETKIDFTLKSPVTVTINPGA